MTSTSFPDTAAYGMRKRGIADKNSYERGLLLSVLMQDRGWDLETAANKLGLHPLTVRRYLVDRDKDGRPIPDPTWRLITFYWYFPYLNALPDPLTVAGSRPTPWDCYWLVQGTYEDNGEAYETRVWAPDQEGAERQAQQECYEANVGDLSEDWYDMLVSVHATNLPLPYDRSPE